jgi:hypothetical protein
VGVGSGSGVEVVDWVGVGLTDADSVPAEPGVGEVEF